MVSNDLWGELTCATAGLFVLKNSLAHGIRSLCSRFFANEGGMLARQRHLGNLANMQMHTILMSGQTAPNALEFSNSAAPSSPCKLSAKP